MPLRGLRPTGLLALAAALAVAAGCGARLPLVSAGVGSMRVESLGERRVAVTGRVVTSLYSDAGDVETTFILADAPVERLLSGDVQRGQILHVELLWLPRPGWTPVSADATNASVRYVVVADGEVGVYAGAGFALPKGGIGGRTAAVSLQDASLRLVDSTEGFVDLLTPARISGNFTATRDPRKTRQAHYAMSQIVTDALGRSVFALDDLSVSDAMVQRPTHRGGRAVQRLQILPD